MSPAPEATAAEIRGSGLFDADWYRRRYPDVAQMALDPLTHFLRIGLRLGRDPGPVFSSPAYLAANPDVAAAGVPAVLHYLRSGRAEGRALRPAAPAIAGPLARAQHLRALLERGGVTDPALAALAALAGAPPEHPEGPAAAALAAEALAVWSLRAGDRAACLGWCARRLDLGGGAAVRARLAPLMALASDRAGVAALRATHPDLPGLRLAAMNAEPAALARLEHLNAVLTGAGLTAAGLTPGADPALDRLQAPCPADPESLAPDAPRISVILAARDAAATLPAAIRSVLAQSWRALELIVIDDASRDDTARVAEAAARADPRLRLIRLERNRGAYGARNEGLAAATGEYVTLHDADDWAHPERLARQIRALRAGRGLAGCLSLQARVTGDLAVSRWTGTGAVLHENLAALMLPRGLLRDTLGGWDEVRVSADAELLRRARRLFGAGAVPVVGPEAPLCLLRDGGASATADPATGMDWFLHGARAEYLEAQAAHHARAAALRHTPGRRPFPAPAILLPDALRGHARDAVQRFDLILAGYLCQPDAELLAALEAGIAAGRRIGLVALHGMHLAPGAGLDALPGIRRRIDGSRVAMLCHGERAEAGEVRLFGPPPPPLRYLPEIRQRGRGDPVLAPARG